MHYKSIIAFVGFTFLVLGGLLVYVSYTSQYASAAESAVDTTIISNNAATNVGSPAAVWISDTTGFVFYKGAEGDIEMASTTDSGASWTSGRTVDSVNTTDAVSVAIWWDAWTPGTTSTRFIHIATTDTGVDDTYYTRYDTTNNTLSTTVLGTTQGATCTAAVSCYVSITLATNGVLYMATADGSDSWVVSCSTTCTTAGNWSERTSAFGTTPDLGDDYPILMPIPGTNNILLTYVDVSASTIDWNVYSATSSSWQRTATAQVESSVEASTFSQDAGIFGMALSTSTGALALTFVNDANDFLTQDHDIDFYTYASSTGWVSKTNPITTASGGLTGAKVSYDEESDIWYVIYTRLTTITSATTGNIYYRTSSNGGTSWSSESAAINDNEDTIHGLTTGLTSFRRIGAWWNYTTAPRADQEYYDEIPIPPTVALNTSDATAFGTDTTPTLEFTGTDRNSDSVRYNLSVEALRIENDVSHASVPIYGGSGTNEVAAQTVTVPSTESLTRIALNLTKSGSPTDDIFVELADATVDGATIATSESISATSISTGWNVFTFTTPVGLTASNVYAIRLTRSGARDTTNVIRWYDSNNTNPYTDGIGQKRSSAVWGDLAEGANADLSFRIYAGESYISGTDAGFANTTDGGDTDPFDSGDLASFTVQAGDALTTGTYYWRVRAIDPTGSNTYGAWATARSFTIDTGGGGGGSSSTPQQSEFFF